MTINENHVLWLNSRGSQLNLMYISENENKLISVKIIESENE